MQAYSPTFFKLGMFHIGTKGYLLNERPGADSVHPHTNHQLLIKELRQSFWVMVRVML